MKSKERSQSKKVPGFIGQDSSIGFKVFNVIFTLALIHRLFASKYLHTSASTTLSNLLLESIVGVWGDIWISFLLACPFFIASFFFCRTTTTRTLAFFWVLLWTIFTAAHQGYVEYFRQQMIPFHLTYIFDLAFLSANNQTLLAPKSTTILVMGLFLSVYFFRKQTRKTRRRKLALEFVSLTLIAVLAHVANIRWRIQWFVPEALQTHYLEHLFTNLKTKTVPPKLTASDRMFLADISKRSPDDSLQTILSPMLDTNNDSSLALTSLRARLDKIRLAGDTSIIAVVLAESLRPADVGWTRTSTDPTSLTPNLDLLVRNGVNFTHAYSTGPVTRGGQEAAWCGIPTATNTSLMRSFPLFKLACIGDVARTHPELLSKIIWMHGGDTRFDGQLNFWQHHGAETFLTSSDFDSKTPKTGWGVSDLALFERAATQLDATSSPRLLLPMILSVTNHIPWDLPADAPPSISQIPAEHASHRTTAYFDFALGQFIDELKKNGQWKNAVIIVASDHGGLELVRNPSYKANNPLKWEHLASHINLTLTGGVVEDSVRAHELPTEIAAFVSQAQIAPFIASISRLADSGFMDIPLFAGASPWPIASDLNQYLFLPADEQKIPKEKILDGTSEQFSGNAKIAALRYRAFLQMLYEFKPAN